MTLDRLKSTLIGKSMVCVMDNYAQEISAINSVTATASLRITLDGYEQPIPILIYFDLRNKDIMNMLLLKVSKFKKKELKELMKILPEHCNGMVRRIDSSGEFGTFIVYLHENIDKTM